MTAILPPPPASQTATRGVEMPPWLWLAAAVDVVLALGWIGWAAAGWLAGPMG